MSVVRVQFYLFLLGMTAFGAGRADAARSPWWALLSLLLAFAWGSSVLREMRQESKR